MRRNLDIFLFVGVVILLILIVILGVFYAFLPDSSDNYVVEFSVVKKSVDWAVEESVDNEYIFFDDFSSYNYDCLDGGDSFGEWDVIYAGYGCVSLDGELVEEPMRSTAEDETHAAMVVGPEFSDLIYEVDVFTDEHLRQENPNPWEVGWIVWHYIDDEHFYYFIPKPNGWELGKEDPAYPGSQRFLATGSDVLFPIGRWYDVKIEHRGNMINVSVDGQLLVEFTDEESPYYSGRIGLYDEDALVYFDDVRVS